MGKKPSKPVLSEQPWRETIGWGESARSTLIDDVVALRPETKLQIPSFNIVLAGLIGSGKSSFINSISRVLSGRVYLGAAAGAGERADSLTKKFLIYQISPDLPFRICDTMGIQGTANNEVDIINIMKAVEGHVPDRYEFTPGKEFHPNSPGYITNPKPTDFAHCVTIVVNAQTVSQLTPLMEQKLKSLAERFYKEEIPFFVLLTHLDEFCQEVDITKTFHSIAVEELVIKISKMVSGLPENHIFPVINYTKRVEIDANMDVLLLYALRQMLGVCKGYTETQIKSPVMFETPEATSKEKTPTEYETPEATSKEKTPAEYETPEATSKEKTPNEWEQQEEEAMEVVA